MAGESARAALFGTLEETAQGSLVEVGALTCRLDGESVRTVAWNGIEVVRAIAWPVRDQSWITLPQKTESESLDVVGNEARYELAFSVADGGLQCRLSAVFASTGSIRVDLNMIATRDFDTNRAGFTLLHPVEGVAGEKLDILHSDGALEHSLFPRLISPAQPAMDIAGLRHRVDGVDVDIAFGGEVFEMEDQRNWTDASFKTYCRPLVVPFTYRIAAGETINQTVAITLSGENGTKTTVEASRPRLSVNGTMPEIALAVEPGWLPGPGRVDLIEKTGVRSLRARIDTAIDLDFLRETRQLASALKASVDLEIVVPQGGDPPPHLTEIDAATDAVNIQPERVLAVPEPYLKSYQPSGPWPDGATPADCVRAARDVFGSTSVGGGVLTNFTEFNRCRPDPAQCDFVSHGTTAVVHAADDLSVCETLEALPFVFESALHWSEGKPYRLGLVSIGMRSNPYGAGVADNAEQIRQTMAEFDPRQCGIFAAAFAVGVLHATQDFAVQSLALAAPAGPFGIVSQPQPVKRAYFDESNDAVVYPIFHVVRAAAAMTGRTRIELSGLPNGLCGVASGTEDAWDMILANVTVRPLRLPLPAPAAVRLLDTATFQDAVRDPEWLDNAEPTVCEDVTIPPYCVAFVSAGGANT